MQRYVAFLRGMNLGGRRITNEDLCGHVRALGFGEVSAVLASGNVLFSAERSSMKQVAKRLEQGLSQALAYDVPAFVRTSTQVQAVAGFQPFDAEMGEDGGKLQVALFSHKPSAAAQARAMACATNADLLCIHGTELYWLPRGKLTESDLDVKVIDAALGPMTMRTRRTIERIAARLTA